MKSINECIDWIKFIKANHPNIEDINYLNAMEKYLVAYDLILSIAELDKHVLTLEDAIDSISGIDITDGTEPVFSGKQIIGMLRDISYPKRDGGE